MNYEFYPIHGAWIQEILALPRDRFRTADQRGRLQSPGQKYEFLRDLSRAAGLSGIKPVPAEEIVYIPTGACQPFPFHLKTAAAKAYLKKLLVYLLSRNDPEDTSKVIAQKVIPDGTFECHGNYGCGCAQAGQKA